MAVLLIDGKAKSEIARAIERARKRPLPWNIGRQMMVADRPTVRLTDRNAGAPSRESHRPEQVLIPIGYRAMVSFEEQPDGMCMHLSIGVERKDPTRVPSVESVKMIAKEFGIDFPEGVDKMWMEEFEPGRHAINMVVLTAPRQEGHA